MFVGVLQIHVRMSSAQQPLLPQSGEEPFTCRKVLRSVLRFTLITFVVLFAVAWAIQLVMFYYATTLSGCSESALEGYRYESGGTSNGGLNSTIDNILPRISLMVERSPAWYGAAFDSFPSNEASTIEGAQSGTWWRTWGPIFYTYTYQDIASSKTLIYMRRNLLRLGTSDRIVRCDGKGPYVLFTEGGNYLANRIRKLFGMNQAYSFKIYLDDELVSVVEEASGPFPSMTFRDATTGDTQGSSVLQSRSFHGQYDEWLVSARDETPLPYFVYDATTLLYAFNQVNIKTKAAAAAPPTQEAPPTKPPALTEVDLLEVLTNSSDASPRLRSKRASEAPAILELSPTEITVANEESEELKEPDSAEAAQPALQNHL